MNGTRTSSVINAGATARMRKKVESELKESGQELPRKFSEPAAQPSKTESGIKISSEAPKAQMPAATAPQKTAAQKRDEAQQLYDTYIQSDEYKQNLSAANAKAMTDRWMTAAITGSSDTIMQPIKDQKEQELRALVDHYTAQMQQEESQAIMDADLQELEAWSEADRAALETYIINRNQEFATNMNPMATSTFGQQAMLGSKALIEKYGLQKVNEMAESLTRSRNAETAQETAQAAREGVSRGPMGAVGHNATSIPANAVGGLTGLFGYLQELGERSGRYPTMDPNNAGNLPNVYSGAVRGQTAQNIAGDQYDENGKQIKDGGIGRQLLSYGYQGVMSMADSYARLVLGGGAAGGAALAASNTFAQTMSEASAQGATPGQAALLATTKAGIEALSEKIPLDNLVDTAKTGGQSLKMALIDAFAQAGVEIITEEISLFGSVLAEAAILREKSGYQQKVAEAVAGGMDIFQARQQATADLLLETAETAIVSGVSGGLSSAGASAVGNVTSQAAEMQQDPQNAVTAQQEVPTAPAQDRAPAHALEEAAAQLGREAPEAEAKEKSEQELTLERAMDETFGREGNDAGSAAGDLERLQAQEESLRSAADAYASAGDTMVAAEIEADRQKYGDQIRAVQTREGARTGSLTDKDAPAEQETSYPGARNQDSDPLQARSWAEAGDRKTKAYMAENPEVKPFIQQEAQAMSEELANTTKGERGYNEDTHYESGGEKGWWGVSRHTSEDIAELRDSGMSYEQIDKGLNDIIEDHGKENSAAAKRVEMQLNDRLRNGHKDFLTGKWVSRNQAYIDVVNETEANREGREGFDALMEDADNYAPPAQDAEGSAQQADIRRMSPRRERHKERNAGAAQNGDFEAMGAADQNFSGKPAYNATLSEDNAQPDRAGDVRPMELPQRDINGGRVSAVTGNVYAAGITPDEFASLMEEPTARGDFSYIPITNNQATRNATEYISRLGWDDAYHQWAADVRQGMAGAAMSARGALFLNHAAQAGDRRLWLNVLSDFQRLGTNTAQGLQAFRIVRQLAPSDRLYLIGRSVQQMVDDMHLRVPIEIDQDMADRYQNAPTDTEADAILDEIMDDVAAQIPSTIGERWTALRYVNMLGNLRTQVRNISGNVGARAAYMAKDQIAATLEKAVAAVNPNFQRTKSNWVSQELKDLGRADFEEIRDVLLDGGRFDDARRHDSTRFAREVNERRRIYRSEFMERYRRATNWAMNNEYFGDAGFARSAYARAFGGYLKANGFTGSTLDGIDQNLLDNARLYAIQQAQESTFRDRNMLSDWVSGIGRRRGTPAAIRAISEGIMPFRRTPANVLIRAEEFSPLGIINTAVTAARAANPNNEVNGTDVVESMAKTLTGTGLFFMGMLLGKAGLLTGGPDADEEKDAFDKENGEQNYALQLPGGENVTIDWLSPVAVPMFLGAAMEKIVSDGDYDLADFEKVFTSLADPLIQMSMLQGVNDALDDLKYSQNNLGQFFINAAVSYLTQGLTNVAMGQIEKSTESERTTTYVDKDSAVPQWVQRQLGKASQKIPFWDYQQVPYINARGETQKQRTDAVGWLYNLVSPGYVNKFEVDGVSEELYRLNETGATENNVFLDSPSTTFSYTDKDGVAHKDYNLTAEEADALKRVTGQTSVEILKGLFADETYKAMTDQQKAKAVELVYDYAREKGRTAALEGYEGLDGWMQGIEGSEVDAILNKAITGAFTDAFDTLDDNPAAAAQALEQAYHLIGDSYNDRVAFADAAGGRVKYFITARRCGVSAENFVGLYQQFRDIDNNPDLSTSDKAAKWSHELEKVQEAGKITDRQKKILKDSMVYYQMFPAETVKFDQMTEAGISADRAMDIGQLLEGIKPQEGYTNVRDVQKAAAIAGSDLSQSEKTAAMKIYLPDAQDENLDLMLGLGYGPEDYAAAYEIYVSEDDSGRGAKNRTINRIQEEFGVDYSTAKQIYEIYG